MACDRHFTQANLSRIYGQNESAKSIKIAAHDNNNIKRVIYNFHLPV